MKTVTISQFEADVHELLKALGDGETITIEKDGEPFLELQGKKTKTSNWSPEVQAHLDNPNPHWYLEPDPFPREVD